MKKHTIEIQKELFKKGKNLDKYRSLVLGQKGLLKLMKYELIVTLTSNVAGALGLWLRRKLYPAILGMVGRNVTFGRGVVLRHPGKIFIGDNVVIDDHCVLDAKGEDNRGIFIGDGVFISRNTVLNCKNGDIVLDDGVNIGANCTIFSASEVRVGRDNLIGAYSYLVGGTHNFSDPETAVIHQGRVSRGIRIGPGGWIGAHVTVLDGVEIGKHAVIGAGSAVNRKIPDYAVAAGNPVTIINKRMVDGKGEQKPEVTVGIINYNGEDVLKDTINSIIAQDYESIVEIIVIDNCSTDGSIELVKRDYPDIKVVKMKNNRGPNPARNEVLKRASSEFVLIMDNDIILSDDCISLLVDAMIRNPQAGMAGPQIRLQDRPDQIQYNGVNIHFVGEVVMNRYELEKALVVGAVSAGAVLIRRKNAIEIGLFDKDYYFGWEDGDFSFRMTISGFPCLIVSKARVFHKKEKRGMSWVRYQVRNRWWFILKTYNLRTLIFTIPAILIYQFALFVFLLLKGHGIDFIKGSFDVIVTLPMTLKKRREVMRQKRVRDRYTLLGRRISIIGDAGSLPMIRAASSLLNLFFSIYWILFGWLIK